MRDLPGSLDLLVLGRELLLDELAPLLPPERRRDAHLIATVMAIVAREARTGDERARDILTQLAEHYREAASRRETASQPGSLPACRERDGSCAARGEDEERARDLLRRLAADLRNGAFETSPSRMASARAILWRLTISKLREGNPQFLAANGFTGASGEGE